MGRLWLRGHLLTDESWWSNYLGPFCLTKGSNCACLCPGSVLFLAVGVQEQWTLSPVLISLWTLFASE